MFSGNYSDLPEHCVTSSPRRATPTQLLLGAPPSNLPLPIRRPSPHVRESSQISSEPRESVQVTPRPSNPSRTSLAVAADGRRDHINIGIDFGTTFSGVSWALSSAQTIHTISNWPNGDHVKVPTELAYTLDGPVQWGYAVQPGLEKLCWFKLLLAEEYLPEPVQNSQHLVKTKALLNRLGKKVEEVTADYLRRLWDYALAEIRRQIPSSIDGMPFRIVLGMPANWPLDAQEKLRRAATKAGMLNRRPGLDTVLEFVAEPEAAAIAAFYEGNLTHDIEIGHTVVICDAGGGTVDIVTYEVTRIRPSITLSESISGNMALCGSIFLDENFIKFMEGLVGKDKLHKLSRTENDELMDVWEHKVKRQYQNDKTEIAARLPHPVAKAIDRPVKKLLFRKGPGSKQLTGDVMRFSAADIKGIFNPVMSNILKLILEQRNETMRRKGKKPKAILLVGGLGGNKFLYERLQAEFDAGDIDVLQPSGAYVWASICRGAAIKCMGYDDLNDDQPFPVVTSYISKAHYGMAFKEPYDDSKHTGQDRKEYDKAEGMDLVWDQMSWYVMKNDDVSKGEPVVMAWEFKQPEQENRARKNYSITIYQCATQDAPTRRTKDVRECVTITFPASRQNTNVHEGPDGQLFRVVRFDVKMTLLGMGKVHFATYVNGELAGQKDVRVDR